MTDHQDLRTLLRGATDDVPAPRMTATVVAGARRRRMRHRLATGATLAAVGAAGAVGVGVSLPQLEPGNGIHAANGSLDRTAQLAPVADAFSCAHTLAVPAPRLGEIYGDGPDFGVGNEGAKRYQVRNVGQTHKVLRVGDANGALTARVNLRPGTDGWVIDGYERCTGPNGSDVPVAQPFRLGAHGRALPAPNLHTPDAGDPIGQPPTSSAVTVDDRPFYNRIGVIQHRTLVAYETRDGLFIAEVIDGRNGGGVATAADEAPADLLGPSFIPTGDPGVEPGTSHETDSRFAAWAYYTRGQANVAGKLTNGETLEATAFRGGDWKGTLHILLAPSDDLTSVTVEQNGETATYPAGD